MANAPFFYLGYGVLSDRGFVKELLGRKLYPWETEDVMYGYKLKILQGSDLPEEVRRQTPDEFRIYGLAQDENGRGVVKALMLDLSHQERQVVRELNFGYAIFKPHDYLLNIRVRTDILKDQSLGIVVPNGLTYERFLNGRDATFAVARELREKFIDPVREGIRRRNPEF